MSEENEEKKGFTVVDKRRSAGTTEDTQSKEAVMQEAAGGSPEITFSAFVMSLGTQALIQMGEIPAPEGINVPKDLAAAQQTIDILTILKDKTVGNLDSTEERLIEEMLHNLKMSFVKVK